MNRKLILLSSVLVLALFVLNACATSREDALIKKVDPDGDGKVEVYDEEDNVIEAELVTSQKTAEGVVGIPGKGDGGGYICGGCSTCDGQGSCGEGSACVYTTPLCKEDRPGGYGYNCACLKLVIT